MAKILLVEDDEALGNTLKERLAKEGYSVSHSGTKAQARAVWAAAKSGKAPFDLIVLDVGLPDGSGLDLARDLRLIDDVPILFLSAMNSAENRLEGFELGALDFVPKPFHLKELLMRVRQALDRRGVKEILRCGPCTLEPQAYALVFADGHRELLAQRDFQLLELLVRRAPQALTREEILRALWKGEAQTGRTVDNAIVRLRAVLRKAGAECIRSVRGVGYQYSP